MFKNTTYRIQLGTLNRNKTAHRNFSHKQKTEVLQVFKMPMTNRVGFVTKIADSVPAIDFDFAQ